MDKKNSVDKKIRDNPTLNSNLWKSVDKNNLWTKKNIMNKEELLSKIRGNIRETYDMPSLDDIKATKYEVSLAQFICMS